MEGIKGKEQGEQGMEGIKGKEQGEQGMEGIKGNKTKGNMGWSGTRGTRDQDLYYK